jgi:hypothetical protein
MMELHILHVAEMFCAYQHKTEGYVQLTYRGEVIIPVSQTLKLCQRYYEEDLKKVNFYYNTLDDKLAQNWGILLKEQVTVEVSFIEKLAQPSQWRLSEAGLSSENDEVYTFEELKTLLPTWCSHGDESNRSQTEISLEQLLEKNALLTEEYNKIGETNRSLSRELEEKTYELEQVLSAPSFAPTRMLVYGNKAKAHRLQFRTNQLVRKGDQIVDGSGYEQEFSFIADYLFSQKEFSSPITGYCFPLLNINKIHKFPYYPIAVMSTSAEDSIDEILTWLGQSDLEYRYEP